MIALVDADSLLYKTACAVEEKIDWNENEVEAGLEEVSEVEYYSDLESCKELFDKLVDDLKYYTEIDEVFLVFSSDTNFRSSNPLGYKAHRKDVRKPLYLQEILQYALANYNCKVCDGYEADDFVVYQKTKYPDKYLLCAIDKDVLYQTEGFHYNYHSGEVVETTAKEAIIYSYYQTLVGDASDGYKGCKGIGPVKANKIINEVVSNCSDEELEVSLWKAVVDAYESKGLTEEDALWTMRLANMHQLTDNGIQLWLHPTLDS